MKKAILSSLNLQTKMQRAFLIMGLLVLVISLVSYSITADLSRYINTLSTNSLPSIDGLWKINEGQAQIHAAEKLIVEPTLPFQQREVALKKIEKAWLQINSGFEQAELTPMNNEEEEKLYKNFLKTWNIWKQKHEELMLKEKKFHQLGIRNPEKISEIPAALELRNQIIEHKLQLEELFQESTTAIHKVLQNNQQFTLNIKKSAEKQVKIAYVIVNLSIIVGLFTAIVLGVFFSIKIARPVDKTIKTMLYELEFARDNLEKQVEMRTSELSDAIQHLQETQQQLIQAEKMSSLGQMVAGIAHEINNPVSFIKGNICHASQYFKDLLELLQLYQEQYSESTPLIQQRIEEIDLEYLKEDIPKIVESIKSGSERIRQIVISLRNFSRLDEAEVKDVNINDGIDSTLLILNHRLNQNIEIIKNYGNLPLVECYPAPLNQVFMNIISNAIDALLACDKKKKEIIIQTSISNNETIEIKISDNGLGIPDEVKQKIFDPFFTTKPVGQGTGLGLSICYQIMEKHHGKISVSSEPGAKTEFLLSLPLKIGVGAAPAILK